MSAVPIHAKTTQPASMMSTDTFVNVTRDSEVRKFVLWAWQPYKCVGSEKNFRCQRIYMKVTRDSEVRKGGFLYGRGNHIS